MKVETTGICEAGVRIGSAPKRVLVIAYYFPPYGGGGVARVHSFVKYLPQLGVVPLVYSVKEEFYDECYRDPELLTEYDNTVQIVRSRQYLGSAVRRARSAAMTVERSPSRFRTWVSRLLKRLAIPDEHVGWVLASRREATNLVRTEKIDAILATGPPFSAHLLATLVARATGAPLVLDYRDLWSGNQFYSQPRWISRMQQATESFTLRTAHQVIVTNHAAASRLSQLFRVHPGVMVVENGFDAEELSEATAGARAAASDEGTLTISYIGSLTSRRTPEFFFAALKSFLAAHRAVRVKVVFAGYAAPHFKMLASNMALGDSVEFTGELSRKSALELMCRSDVLLVLQRRSEGGDTAIPGKLYEYLATGKPVVALDEGRGPTSQFLLGLGVDFVAEYDDPAAIRRLLERVLLDYAGVARQYAELQPVIARYERRKEAETVANLLRQCART